MAKIFLNIEADDAYDLQRTLVALAALGTSDDADAPVGEGGEAADPTPRKRRQGRSAATAAALEAGDHTSTDNAASAAAGLGTSASAAPASAASPGTSASSPESSGQSPAAVTAEVVKAAMSKAMEATSPLIAQKALSDNDLPVRMSELSAEQYPKALQVLNDLAASV